MAVNGKVKWFNGTKGFGFIARDDKEKDVFVHISAVKESGMETLKEGQKVVFDIDLQPKGPVAVNLTTPDINSQFSKHFLSIKQYYYGLCKFRQRSN